MKPVSAKQVQNKTVLVRVDYNVPLHQINKKIEVVDDSRIKASLATIELLLKARAKIILISHLGRPGGQVKPELSLKPVAEHLARLIGQPVEFAADCVGDAANKAAQDLQPGQILLLENLRFHQQEKKNDLKFSKQLARLAEVYVNEAFSTCHRSHASIVGVAEWLPSYPGLALVKEVEALTSLMNNPERPFVMVVGGAKISDKIDAVTNLSKIANAVLVGGGVANNFLKADGYEIANSYLQDVPADLKKNKISYVEVAREIIDQNKTQRVLKDGYIPLPKIIYPIDVIAAKSLDSKKTSVVNLFNGEACQVKKDQMFLDIGPKTVRLFQEVILHAKTVFWNGPMGVFEQDQFAQGTREVARTIAKAGAMTILGGGDTISAINQFGLADRYDYVSAAGGASLEFLSGKELPGIKSLKS
ncbi:MAG: phosphoglycerate kinase [Candidatus Pacebacteria bacterium]|nr:phosphoglycerate kinase [Candidatus Paceibacterota bacterium]